MPKESLDTLTILLGAGAFSIVAAGGITYTFDRYVEPFMQAVTDYYYSRRYNLETHFLTELRQNLQERKDEWKEWKGNWKEHLKELTQYLSQSHKNPSNKN